MSNETSKNHKRRSANGDYDKYFSGFGIDIGAGHDLILPNCCAWDKKDGDATLMERVADESFSWVHSSHCLEHLNEPHVAIENWWRILRPGGHMIITVPDWSLYEQKIWPSRFNTDHKTGYDVYKLLMLVGRLPNRQVLRLQINDIGYNYDAPLIDQTPGEAQAEIEMIVRKLPDGSRFTDVSRITEILSQIPRE